jgi:hypothetical protein
MNKGSTLFLKVVILFIALAVFGGMLWFPQTEGRATHLDSISIYTDPFIIYLYIASLPFFIALYQAFKLLGYIEQNKAFSQIAVDALRNIKYCAIALSAFMAGSETFIIVTHGNDDAAGAVMVGFIVIFASFVIATAAAVFQKLLQNAVDIKSENDLTV